jgi:ABC-2 type transport system ATP-binding protein
LTKDYGPARAVDRISFEVPQGQVLGFLGPNGAGKSTTMKMLTCYLAPTSGRAQVGSFDVFSQHLEVRKRIGYLPEDTPLYKDMTVLEYLDYITEMRRIPKADRRARVKKIGEVTGIMSVLGKKIGELSRGYRQRVGLTQAMVHDPQILILDEPTSGLDPNQIVEIRGLIKELGKEKTVILSTHILPEVQATCSRVIIIAGGKLVADGDPEELVRREVSNTFRVAFDAGELDAGAVKEKLGAVRSVSTVADDKAESGAIQFILHTDGTDVRRELHQLAIENKWPLLALERRPASLEEVFGRLTKGQATPAKDPVKPAAKKEAA